jgi:hypothetical protein
MLARADKVTNEIGSLAVLARFGHGWPGGRGDVGF